ncbi:HD domain-containing protein [Taibaiella soli]|uniref:Metal-dependent HD superfamily phosphohydrolase n=1 Tax=Taibaiella soli TaxID=1649169 RepID=A0A2W2B517_9BACT|nr:hypothetical protein [Taibaiella soli]PZF71319.1 hypothetical protein DN068_18665 [Taibaiella soli]
MLKEIFTSLMQRYTNDLQMIDRRWKEIELAYSAPKRYYHTLTHLSGLITELDDYKEEIDKWDTVLFSVFYHDIVYNTLQQDNEEQSALIAVERMSELHFPSSVVTDCKEQILATKSHELSDNNDTNLFTDADLAILGKDPETYRSYASQIRKEYRIYPDIVYKPGRQKVLQHFLSMPRIYKTELFRNKYEHQARTNIARELTEG